MVLMKDLEATNLVLEKDGDERRVGVLASTKGQMRLGARGIVVSDQCKAFKTFRLFETMQGQA